MKQLSTQAPSLAGGVSAAVANAAAGVSGAAGIVTGSPEYRGPSRVNLEAGGELLEAYQTQWERIHLSNEKNAKMATRDAPSSESLYDKSDDIVWIHHSTRIPWIPRLSNFCRAKNHVC